MRKSSQSFVRKPKSVIVITYFRVEKVGCKSYFFRYFLLPCFLLPITVLPIAVFPGGLLPFSYPEPFLRAVNGARRGALAKFISNWHLIGYNEGYCSNTGYILLPCFHGIRLWIWPEPLVAPRVRRALGTRMGYYLLPSLVILVPRALLTRGATRGSGQIHNRIPQKHGKKTMSGVRTSQSDASSEYGFGQSPSSHRA